MAVNRNLVDKINAGAMTPEEYYNLTQSNKIENKNNKTQEENKMTEVKFETTTEMVQKEEAVNTMKGQISVAIVSRKEQALVFYDLEGQEGFYTAGAVYGNNTQLGHMVLAHNFLQKINSKGLAKPGMMINFQMTGLVRNFLNGRRVDKLDKLENWAFKDDRKQENWKAVSRELARQITIAKESGATVVFTAGTGERTFRRAWNELNKIAPKATQKAYAGNYGAAAPAQAPVQNTTPAPVSDDIDDIVSF